MDANYLIGAMRSVATAALAAIAAVTLHPIRRLDSGQCPAPGRPHGELERPNGTGLDQADSSPVLSGAVPSGSLGSRPDAASRTLTSIPYGRKRTLRVGSVLCLLARSASSSVR